MRTKKCISILIVMLKCRIPPKNYNINVNFFGHVTGMVHWKIYATVFLCLFADEWNRNVNIILYIELSVLSLQSQINNWVLITIIKCISASISHSRICISLPKHLLFSITKTCRYGLAKFTTLLWISRICKSNFMKYIFELWMWL